MMQVDVPTTFTTSPSRIFEPIASQCASNAPTGIGIPARSPSFSAHSAERCPASLSLVRYSPPIFARTPASSGSTATRNSSGGSPPHFGFHIHLWPIAQTLRFSSRTLVDAAQRRRHHVAVLERRHKHVAACPDCAAASAAASQIPTRASRRRRTTRSLRAPSRAPSP